MRVAFYNQMFGTSGRSLTEFLHVHLLHGLQKYHLIENIADVSKTIKTVKESNSDIIGISEIVGIKQRESIIKQLTDIGYKYFHTGIGHGLGNKYGGHVESIVASKEQSECFYSPIFFTPNRSGFGGGIIGIFLPLKNLYIMQVHMPLARIYRRTHSSFKKQLKTVMNKIEDMIEKDPKIKMIMMGDFNMDFKHLCKIDKRFNRYFTKISAMGATCTFVPFIKHFYQKDIDHVLGYNQSSIDKGFIEGESDHRLVWVDVEG